MYRAIEYFVQNNVQRKIYYKKFGSFHYDADTDCYRTYKMSSSIPSDDDSFYTNMRLIHIFADFSVDKLITLTYIPAVLNCLHISCLLNTTKEETLNNDTAI